MLLLHFQKSALNNTSYDGWLFQKEKKSASNQINSLKYWVALWKKKICKSSCFDDRFMVIFCVPVEPQRLQNTFTSISLLCCPKTLCCEVGRQCKETASKSLYYSQVAVTDCWICNCYTSKEYISRNMIFQVDSISCTLSEITFGKIYLSVGPLLKPLFKGTVQLIG